MKVVFQHGRTCAFHDSSNTALANKHMVGCFGEHKPCSSRQRGKSGLGETLQLHLAIAIGEESEHEVRQPVGRCLIKRPQ